MAHAGTDSRLRACDAIVLSLPPREMASIRLEARRLVLKVADRIIPPDPVPQDTPPDAMIKRPARPFRYGVYCSR